MRNSFSLLDEIKLIFDIFHFNRKYTSHCPLDIISRIIVGSFYILFTPLFSKAIFVVRFLRKYLKRTVVLKIWCDLNINVTIFVSGTHHEVRKG